MPPVDYVTYCPPTDYLPDALDGKSTYTASIRELTQRLVALENENARLTAKNQAFLSEMQALDNQMDRNTLAADNAHLQSQLALLERHNAELSERLAGVEQTYQGKLADASMGHDLARMKETEIQSIQARNEVLVRQKEAQLKELQSRFTQVNRDLEAVNGRLAARERDLAQTRSAEAMGREQLIRRSGLLERHVEQRTSELQSATQRAMTAEEELHAVRTWWKKKNSGMCGSSDLTPWKSYQRPVTVPPPPALPALPAPTVTRAPPSTAPLASTTTAARSMTPPTAYASTAGAAGGSSSTAPYFGMVVKQNPGSNVVFISSLDAGAPASQAGLQVQDQIVSFGGVMTSSIGQFRSALKQNAVVGRKVPVVVAGNQGAAQPRTTAVTVGARSRQVVSSAPQLRSSADVDAVLRDRAKLQEFTIAAFNICDSDGSGVISRQELTTGMRRVLPAEMGRFLSDSQVQEAFTTGDADNSNFLVGTEFLPVMEACLKTLSANAKAGNM